jgi:hypothetical protein
MDMKLLGIELIDVEKANKYVEIKKRIDSIDNDFSDEEVEEVNNYITFDESWCEQIYLITLKDSNGYRNIICYCDKDDGYRSYAGKLDLNINEALCENLKHLNLKVYVKEDFKEIEGISYKLLIKYKSQKIFKCFTDSSFDEYYPVGIVNYDITGLNQEI